MLFIILKVLLMFLFVLFMSNYVCGGVDKKRQFVLVHIIKRYYFFIKQMFGTNLEIIKQTNVRGLVYQKANKCFVFWGICTCLNKPKNKGATTLLHSPLNHQISYLLLFFYNNLIYIQEPPLHTPLKSSQHIFF